MVSRDKQTYKHHANPSILASFRASLSGLGYALANERNLKVHAGVTVLVLIIVGLLGVNAVEASLLLLVTGLVWCMELVNSAVEATVDLVVGEQLHPLAKVAKDVAAAAVVVAALVAVGVGFLVLGPKVWHVLAILLGLA
ncbi:diacylglycerol kinase family protein [Abiotrophia sp. HMSC24B09]|uniref:diacylglycerol kinase family protein n=1 Tax=Abiotrophia sp. HMSC24B09 TaxID=1581061 RepID=UPI0025BAEBA7|nr:diacylglycerol kinase family protein [Abiotrophia sp. HMSC24B09]